MELITLRAITIIHILQFFFFFSVPRTAISTSHALSHLVPDQPNRLFFDANYLIHLVRRGMGLV